MENSSSNLVDNFAEGIHKTKCKDCNYFFQNESVKDSLIKYKFLSYNKNYSNKIYGEKKKKRSLRIHLSFLTTILINFFRF